MSINFNTAASSVSFNHLEVTYNTTMTVNHQGFNQPQPISHSIAIEDMPVIEAAALVTLRTYMENQCKLDRQSKGVTFDN
jgi:hypothetical protein